MVMTMDGGEVYFNSCNIKTMLRLDNVDEEVESRGGGTMRLMFPPIPRLQTPKEPMEFLARSWSLSATEIAKAVAWKRKGDASDRFPEAVVPQAPVAPEHHQHHRRRHHQAAKILSSINAPTTGHSFGQWFHHHHKDFHGSSTNRKDRARIENAQVHSVVSIAGLAAGLAAIAVTLSTASDSRLSSALASATELLASHCIELAELAGANHDRMASVIGSAVGIRSPGDLMTLTAAAATALRAEAALKDRGGREARNTNTASISPYDKGPTETHHIVTTLRSHVKEATPPCEGELLLHTQKRGYHWTHVSVFISKSSQVKLKLKNKHVAGAFTKNTKCVVFCVCDEISTWPYRKERDTTEEVYFGLRTGKGFLEFKCKNKAHKQRWVDAVWNLLRHCSVGNPTLCSSTSI